MKPPKNLAVANDDEDGHKTAGRGFGGDSFRNYMARKIELQRNQFGLVLPPDPRENAYKAAPATITNRKKRKRVQFSRRVQIQEFACENYPRKKVKRSPTSEKSGPLTVLERLQHKYENEKNESDMRMRSNHKESTTKDQPQRKDETKTDANGRTRSCRTSEEKLQREIPVQAGSKDGLDATLKTQNIADPVYEPSAMSTHIVNDPSCGDPVDVTRHNSVIPNTQSTDSSRPGRRPDLFFYGVVVLVNGYTEPDAGTIQRMIHRHGGDLEKYETGRVTHIIAEHLSTAKANIYKRQRKPTPVCRPQWIVDSVKAYRLLPWAEYLLDEVKNEDVGSKTVKSFFTKTTESHHQESPNTGKQDARLLPPPANTEKLPSSVDGGKICGVTGTLEACKQVQECSQKRILDPSVHVVDVDSILVVPGGKARPETNNEETLHQPKDGAKKDCDIKPHLGATGLEEENEATIPQLPQLGDEVEQQYTIKSHSLTNTGQVRTVGTDPNFLESYFSSSRLSFIGSFKQRSTPSPTRNPRRSTEKPQSSHNFVFHVDMDCFFASVVIRNYPEYRNKPVVISHGNKSSNSGSKRSTSECATCNYEARKYGIKKGMFLGRARELCPDLVVLHYDFDGYEEVSEQVVEILYRYADQYNGAIEQVSCDEAYMELFLPSDAGEPRSDLCSFAGEVAESIRKEIFSATQCTASVGVGKNKLLAKLATDRVKPNKHFVVRDFRDILEPLRLRDLPGIGYKKDRELQSQGLVTVRDVWELGDRAGAELKRILGNVTGTKIRRFCDGVDDSPIHPAVRKSIGAECNYGVRFDGPYGVDHMISGLAKEVQKRMERVGVRGARLTLKLKQRKQGAKAPPKFLGHGSCHNHSKSSDVPLSRDWQVLARTGMLLFDELNIPKEDVRGMGIVVTKLGNEDSPAIAVSSGGSIKSFLQASGKTDKAISPSRGATSDEHENSSAIENRFTTEPHQEPSLGYVGFETSGASTDNRGNLACGDFVEEMEGASGSERLYGELGIMEKSVEDQQNPEAIVRPSEQERLNGCFRDESLQYSLIEEPNIDSNDDVALPPLSQIRMSQVMALPSDLRDKVISKIQSSRPTIDSAHNETVMKKDARLPNGKNESTRLHDTSNRFRQVSVKRMMKLVAVKNGNEVLVDGSGDSISPTQLESLPLELQLQVANNDDCSVGLLSPNKCRSSPSKKMTSPERTPCSSERQSTDEPFTVEIDGDVNDEVEVLGDNGFHPTEQGSTSFYERQILPLQEWMDAHSDPSMDDVDHMEEFLRIVVKEDRISDAICMLKSIRSRDDQWSSRRVYHEQLLRAVVDEYGQSPSGGLLDTKWFRLC